jgi:hypothetical protein
VTVTTPITSDGLAADIIRETEGMKADRSIFDATWQEVRDNIMPSGAAFIGRDPDGVKSNQYLLDETPEQAHQLEAAALHGMLMNPALKWFELATSDANLNDIDEVAGWLAHARDRMLDAINEPAANATAAHHETFLETTGYGTGCLYTAERQGGGLLIQSRPLQEVYMREGTEGHIDTVHRWFEKTPRQAVQEWGADPRATLPAQIQEMANDVRRKDNKLRFIHAVYPRIGGGSSMTDPAKYAIASCYVSVDYKTVIREGGYHEMPYACPRLKKRAGEVYGRGDGITALPSAKMLQRTSQVTIEGGEMAIHPPLGVADDGVLSPVRMHSKGLTYFRAESMMRDGNMPVRPILNGAKPELGEEMMQGQRQRIQASFHNHLLQTMRDPRATATQIIQIAEETIRILGPYIGRIQAELMGPHIQRVFGILLRANAFLPLPRALWGQKIVVNYVSPVAQAQKLAEAKGIVQTFQIVSEMAQVNPEVLDNFDFDQASRTLGVMFGMPRYLIRDPDAIAQIRQQRAQKQQQQELLQNATMAAQGIKNAASALPDIRQGLGLAANEPGAAAA